MEEKVPDERELSQGTDLPEKSHIDAHSSRSKKRTRLIICVVAAAIALLFFGLSYPYLSITALSIGSVGAVAVISLSIVAIYKEWETIYKLSVTAIYIAAIFMVVYFALSKSGLLSSIDSADDIVDYINHSGGVAEVIFVLANFLQVTVIPIPSTVTTTAGAILFEGIWKPLYLTVIGLVCGSMLAFFLGRAFGVRFANWLVGEKTIRKYKEMTKGKDKVVLFYMFIFPFFPDDFLCILAGMTNYTYLGFFLLQIVSRTLGTLTTILITKGIVSIPFHGWWILLWGFIVAAVIVFLIFTIKYSEKIERVIMRVIDRLTFGYFGRARLRRAEKGDAAEEGLSPESAALSVEKGDIIQGEDRNDTHDS